jgi:hypothetical protein
MSQLYELKLAGGDSIEITKTEAEAITDGIAESDTGFIKLGESFVRANSIMAILPSKKSHPKFREYVNFKNSSGNKMSFETYLDEINYPRQVNDKLGAGNDY